MSNQIINYSFIIPHHNSPVLLQRCVDSIPQREDIEIIIVDDNSEPDKHAKVDRPDVKIVIIDKEHTKGAGKARNVGLMHASGKWVLFPDCDDFYEKEFIYQLDKYIETQSVDVVYWCNYYLYDVASKKETLNGNDGTFEIQTYLSNSSDLDNQIRVKHRVNANWDMMVRHDLVKKYGLRFEELPKGNDAFFKHSVGMYAKNIAVIKNKLYYWVKNEGSITHRKWTKQQVLENLKTKRNALSLMCKAKAWSCIPSFRRGLGKVYREFGLLFFIRYIWAKLLIVNWSLIWFHKYLKKCK